MTETPERTVRGMNGLIARRGREAVSPALDVLALLRSRARPAMTARRATGALTIVSYNVHKCVGVDKRFDPARIADVIAETGADILALQEADRRLGRRVGLLDMAAIERRTGLRLLPLPTTPGGHGWHGNALLVRVGQPAGVRRLTLPGGEPRGAVIADLEFPAGRFRVVAAHLGLLKRHRERQAQAILAALAEEAEVPTVVLGDLNEWRPGQRSSLGALERSFGHVRAAPPTFPSRLPVLALDRMFWNRPGLVAAVEAHDTPLARLASDHLPLRARLDPALLAGGSPALDGASEAA